MRPPNYIGVETQVVCEKCNKVFMEDWRTKNTRRDRGEDHRYYPDFYVPSIDTFIEIKGIQDELWEAKKLAFPHRLETIGKKEINDIKNNKYIADWCNG